MTGEYFTDNLADLAHQVTEHVLRDTADCPHVLVGPPVWEPTDSGTQRWYFIVASGAPNDFRSDQVIGNDQTLTGRLRTALLLALQQRRPIVVHDMDDELDMARWCATIWPGDKTATILAAIERERHLGLPA